MLFFIPFVLQAQYFDWIIDTEKATKLGILTGEYLGNYAVMYSMSDKIKSNEKEILTNFGEILTLQSEYLTSLKSTTGLLTNAGTVKEILDLANEDIRLFIDVKQRCEDMRLDLSILGSPYILSLTTEIGRMSKIIKDVVVKNDHLMRYDERIQLLHQTKKMLLDVRLLLRSAINTLNMIYLYDISSKRHSRQFGVEQTEACNIAKQTLAEYKKLWGK